MFRTEKIRKLVAMGIPESLRGKLWLLFSGKCCWYFNCSFWSRHRNRGPDLTSVYVLRLWILPAMFPDKNFSTLTVLAVGPWSSCLRPLGCGVFLGQCEVWLKGSPLL